MRMAASTHLRNFFNSPTFTAASSRDLRSAEALPTSAAWGGVSGGQARQGDTYRRGLDINSFAAQPHERVGQRGEPVIELLELGTDAHEVVVVRVHKRDQLRHRR